MKTFGLKDTVHWIKKYRAVSSLRVIMKNINFKMLFERTPSQMRSEPPDECVRSNFRKGPARRTTTGNYEDHLDHLAVSVAAVRTWIVWRSTRSVAWRNVGTRRSATPAKWTPRSGCLYRRTCLGVNNRGRQRDSRGMSGRRASMSRRQVARNGWRDLSYPRRLRIDPESSPKLYVDIRPTSGVIAPTWLSLRSRRRASLSNEGTRTASVTHELSLRGWSRTFSTFKSEKCHNRDCSWDLRD